MGCLNSTRSFSHWFGNIHLSGPCNRQCYFCIGQHMMALDPLNVLDTWPLPGLDDFVEACQIHGVCEINLTGTNTEPLLYRHIDKLKLRLLERIPGLIFGLRTNGVLAASRAYELWSFDKLSVTVCSLDKAINNQMMGGDPPDLPRILRLVGNRPLKLNVVLGPDNVDSGDLYNTLNRVSDMGVVAVNLREPYGQPRIGDPINDLDIYESHVLGMPQYNWRGVKVTYWDVHYVEVESVNLYATGRVSTDYPITRGHDPNGVVRPQDKFTHGRHVQQWQGSRRP